jgi:putative hydrolase of the HAD superfamily
MKAVTFDFGQTLADLDTVMLAKRAAERGVKADAASLEAAVPAAWRVYDEAIARGEGGHPWKRLMTELLRQGGVEASAVAPLVDWLWTEQPKRNLWRRPIPGMIEIVSELRDAGVRVGVVSNSEGKLAQLIEEMGWTDRFEVVADSGVLGIEKPDAAIFAWAAERLGVSLDDDEVSLAHVGDSLAADVRGAIGAGIKAIWFRGRTSATLPAGALVALDAAGTRAALVALGAPIAMF